MGHRRRRGRPARLTLTLALALGAGGGTGCSDECCTIDSLPITLSWAPLGVGTAGRPGGLLAQARWRGTATPAADPFPMSVDTGSPLTVSDGSADGTPETVSRSFDIVVAPLGDRPTPPVRAQFTGIDMLPVPLGTVGDATTRPLAVMGGDLLRGFSVEFHFSAPSMTFWPNQRADDGFLEDVGYAVLHFAPFGGGEITANGSPDLLGLRGPINVPATRVVFRACITPKPFDPTTASQELCCKRGDEVANANAMDAEPLSLVLATGVGPLVLSRSVWRDRLLPKLGTQPDEVPGYLYIAAAAKPIAVAWTTLPAAARLALVNKEASDAADPGPCVELGRSRRIEWVAYQQERFPEKQICVQPCDTDPDDSRKAQNSAAYIELGGDVGDEIPVAVVEDGDPFLEGLRTDIRPEGPEVDGIIGAGVLSHTRLELDYRSSGMRAIFSCEGTPEGPPPTRDQCWTGARCPRLPDRTQMHACFNLPRAGLPATCADNMCGR